MRILNFADGFTSSEEPSKGTITSNNLNQFVDDAAYVVYKTSPATHGDIYFNTTYSTVRYYNGVAWVDVVASEGGVVTVGDLVVDGDLTVNGTTTTLNTATLEVTDLNITVNNGGDDTSAQGAGLTVERTGTAGSIVYDSTKASKWKAGDLSSEKEIVTVSDTQTLTNKTLTSPTIATPTGLVKGDVGLGSVDNTSDATKNSASVTLTNKTLTAPVINSPTGLVRADVGLSNVDNTSDATKNAASVTLTNKTLTAPVINSPTGLVKADVGLGNVDNTSDTTKNAATVTLTNKTLGDALTVTQISTPSAPSSGKNKIYAKADGAFYNLNSSGIESPLGSGSGGLKNYLGTVNGVNGNGNFELGTAAGWNVFSTSYGTGPTGAPSIGSIYSSFIISAVTTGKLAGTYSGEIYLGGGGAGTGEGVISDAFTLDAEDRAKPFSGSFYYEALNMNYITRVFAIYLYDVANSVWIQPSNVYGINSLGINKCSFEFQTASNATSYRLAIILNDSGGISFISQMRVDDFVVGPSVFNNGSPVTDTVEVSMTVGATTTPPTQGGTVVKKVTTQRIGDSLKIVFQYSHASAGSAGSGTYLFPLPAGLAVDTSKVTITTNAIGSGGTILGKAFTADTTSGGANFAAQGSVYAYNATNLHINTSVAAGQTTSLGSTHSTNFGDTAFTLNFEATVPILGWSSSVQMSDSADTRVVDFVGYKTANQAVTANTTNLTFLVNKDSHGAWNTDTYTVPVPGDYVFTCRGSTAAGLSLHIYVNGVAAAYLTNMSSSVNLSGQAIVTLKAGDAVTLRSDTSSTINASGTIITTASVLTIHKLSGPSAIAATETIAASYYCSANFAASTTIPINFDSKEYDTHGAVTPSATVWRFTAPAAGIYNVGGFFTVTSSAANFRLYKNGSSYRDIAYSSTSSNGSANTDIRLVAGDYIEIRPSASVTVIGGTSTAANVVHVCIKRISR